MPGADVTGGTAGTPFSLATGTLAFNGLGKLSTVNGGAPADVTDHEPGLGERRGGRRTSRGISSTRTARRRITRLRVAVGDLVDHAERLAHRAPSSSIITINQSGELVASFGVGRTVVVGQLALATFNNPQGLVKLGTNLYSESEASGIPSVGIAGTGGRGTLIGSALEQSNVDIAQEFTQMILAQRGYQANSKSITVADELLVDTLNLKR